MYQPYPGQNQGQNQMPLPTKPPVPQSVTRAAQIMYAGAAASIIGIIIEFLTRHSIRSAIISHNHKLTTSQINTAYHVELGALLIGGLIAAGLWLWMAQSSKAGKSWARIVSTVLFGIDTLSLIASAAAPGGAASRIYGILVWLIGLAAIILLWRRDSTAFFKGAPQY
jgi:hypothetical protein